MQVIQRQIIKLTDIEKPHQQNFDALTYKIYCLQNEKNKIERFGCRLRDSNKKYLKIKSIVKEIVNGLLTEQEIFLDLALKAAIEALRMNSDMYVIIYNIKYDGTQNVFDGSTTTAAAVPYTHTSTSTQSQNQHQNRYYNEYCEGISEIANSLLKMLLNQMVDNTKVTAVKEKVDVSRFSQEGNQKGTTKTGTCGILS